MKSEKTTAAMRPAEAKESSRGEVVTYNQDGMPQLEVWLEDETIWLTQRQMGDLFGCTLENVIQHLKNIYDEDELAEEATTKEFLVVR